MATDAVLSPVEGGHRERREIIYVGWGLPHRSKHTVALEIGKVSLMALS